MVEQLYMTEEEASKRYRYSKYWFQRKRFEGGGPPFLKMEGRVLYPIKETDKWFMSHGLKNSTSEYAKEGA